ncbi:hypothetical protein EYF80_013956 [Liparis tanakae]|uniref:Uncharacterized protein n=1 Tax=Liparis tanakae TaxID=230148 RepID=A0A4Z2ICK6_9TELE|nr:hypothetical protein EYF80_013956 [Liparis tanakae]
MALRLRAFIMVMVNRPAVGKVRHGEQEDLVKHRIQRLAVHLGLVLGLAVGEQVDLHVRVGGAGEVLGRELLRFVDLNYQLFQVAVKLEDEVEAAATPASATAVLSLEGALFVEFGFDAAEAQTHPREGVLSLELGHVEVGVGQVHVPTDGPLSVGRGKQ